MAVAGKLWMKINIFSAFEPMRENINFRNFTSSRLLTTYCMRAVRDVFMFCHFYATIVVLLRRSYVYERTLVIKKQIA